MLRAAFLPQRESECDRADRDCRIGDIERGPAPGADPDVHEVHDALRAANPVDQVADRAAADQRQRDQPEPVAGTRAPHQRGEDEERDHGEAEKDPARVLAHVQAERCAFVVDETELHDVADDPERQPPRQERLRDQFGDVVGNDDRDRRSPEQPALSGAYHLPLWPCT